MAVFLTGGTGKTSLRIATLLQNANVPFLIGSRRGPSAAPAGVDAVTFDWLDDSTFPAPFAHKFPGGATISAVYLIAPEIDEPSPAMNAFIDYAIRDHGVKRFTLLGGTSSKPGGWHTGMVWQHLLDIGAEYCVLKPSWFMENYTEGWHQLSIKDQHQLYTACADGKIPFISCEDIAAVAFRTLVDEEPHNTSYRILGPELLTHDDIAAVLSKLLGRKIKNKKPSEAERKKSLTAAGLPQHYADFLTQLEVMTANGHEESLCDDVERVIGRPPQTFEAFAQKNKAVWQ